MKDKAKQPWLKTDFNKWRDLDGSDSDEDAEMFNGLSNLASGNGNLEEMLSMMGNKGLGDLDDEDDGNEADADSDDDGKIFL